MTLARQFLLLQGLIVLVVLMAVGAISIAQSARDFERQEIRPARSAAENLAANPLVRERIPTARPGRSSALASVAESVRTVSGSTGVLLTDAEGVALVSSDPTQVGKRVALIDRRVLRGASWTGTQQEGDRTLVVAQVPVYDQDGLVGGAGRPSSARSPPCGRGSATSRRTC